ncbi:MAG: hypothetical protein JST86_11070 [Bacteroidetes bacterium]|nr:hypothetical protein [Bacteroidota bacterium]
MKYIKFLLLNIVAFGGLFFIISLLFPGQVVTSKTISINSTKEKIATKVQAIAQWPQWNLLSNNGSVSADAGNTADSLVFHLQNNNGSELMFRFTVYDQQNTRVLNWDVVQQLPWYKPWRKFSAMVLNKDIANAIDSSLNIFKQQVEVQP